MNRLLKLALAFLVSLGTATAALAQDHGTKDEAKALVEAALSHIQKAGAEKAFADFTDDKATWTKKDLYVFVYDFDGVSRAHGGNAKLVGKSLITLKDPNGKELVKALIETASGKGEGWVDYDWVSPLSKKVEGKSSFVKRVAGSNILVGVGIYR